jgi:hypothetical protein
LGIQAPVLTVDDTKIKNVANPRYDPNEPDSKQPRTIARFDFVVQFWWEETSREERESIRKALESGGTSLASRPGGR